MVSIDAEPKRAGNALGVLDRGEDQTERTKDHRVLQIDAAALVEEREHQSVRTDHPGNDRTGDARDPTEVGKCKQGDRGERPEVGRRHAAESVARQCSTDAGDEGRQAEGHELGAGNADAGGGSGAFVRSNCEKPSSRAATPDVGDHQRQHKHNDEAQHGKPC